jgi:Tol biopolymer transport system component
MTITPTPLATGVFVPLAPETAITTTPTVVPPISETPVGGGGGQVAYASDRSGLPQITLMDITGQNEIQITNMPEGACQPSWSPEGDQLVFTSPCKGMDDIYYGASLYIINADGSNLTPISTVPGGDFDPAWSPQGDSIAFTSLRTGQMEIHLLNLNDRSVTKITSGSASIESRQPAWSRDGSQIAYTVKRLGVYQVWLMNADGSDQKQIVRSGTEFSDYLPSWSPDGELILFNQRCVTIICQPYLMRISGTDRTEELGTRLEFNVVPIEDVEYSRDGFWLVFEGQEASRNVDILYMTVTGANRTRLTTQGGLDFDPSWRPASD